MKKIQATNLDKALEIGDICRITSGTWNGSYVRLNNNAPIYEEILKPQQLTLLDKNQISTSNPVFAGFEIHNLYEFFMVFVVLCGVASIILFALTPKLKKMMHGIK